MSKTITTAILLFLLCGVAVCKGQSTVQVARASVSAFEQETFVTLANDTTSASPVNVKIMPRSANDGPVIDSDIQPATESIPGNDQHPAEIHILHKNSGNFQPGCPKF